MNIDRTQVLDAFKEYTESYDSQDIKILLKIQHTYRVAEISENIASYLGLPESDIDLAWLIGMLHDIGRFEQLRRYHTFVDSQSIDHAHFGTQLLLEEGLLYKFLGNGLREVSTADEAWRETLDIIRKAVYWHSAFRLEETMTQREKQFAKILRDADKIDILKVATDVPLEEIYSVTTEEIHSHTVTPEVMEQFSRRQAILRDTKKVPIDHMVGHIALVFELEFGASYQLVQQQGYLQKLLAFQSPNKQLMEQMQQIRVCMETYLAEQMQEH